MSVSWLNRLEAWPGLVFTHDADGNRTRKQSAPGNPTLTNLAYGWTSDNRLAWVAIVATADTTFYDYNAFGRMVRKRRGGQAVRHFLWSNDQLILELDGAATSRIAEYVYLPGRDTPLALVTGATSTDRVQNFAQDAMGNVIGLHDASGVNGTMQSSIWGTGAPFGVNNRLGFKGMMFEGDSTQLYYARNRWYDPVTRRFLSEDPLQLAGGLNAYLFAGNDPINGSDPAGLITMDARGVCSISATVCGELGWYSDPMLNSIRSGLMYHRAIVRTELQRACSNFPADYCKRLSSQIAKLSTMPESPSMCREYGVDAAQRMKDGKLKFFEWNDKYNNPSNAAGEPYWGYYNDEADLIWLFNEAFSARDYDLLWTLIHEEAHAVAGLRHGPTNEPFNPNELQALLCTNEVTYGFR